MDEFLLELQAKLDEAKSKGNINSDIKRLQDQLNQLKLQAKIDPKSLSSIVKQLEGVLNQKINISHININQGQAINVAQQTGQQIGNAINQGVSQELNNSSVAFNKLHIQADTLKNKLDEFSKKNEGFSTWATEIDGVTISVETLKAELDIVNNQSDLSDIGAKINNLKSSFQAANQITEKMSTDMSRLNNVASIQKWADNNTKAMKKYGDEINDIIKKMNDLDQPLSLENSRALMNRAKEIINLSREQGLLGLNSLDKLKNAWGKFGGWSLATGSLMSVWHIFQQMPKDVVALDTALVDLKKTTDATAQELEDFYYSANDTAKQLGVTTEAVISATAAWSRLGYSIKDAQMMAENSAILTSISPDIKSIDESTDALVSVLKAYKIDAEDSLDGVISKINIIGNTQAVSNGDIVDILTRSSSAMAEANNTLEQTIALGTAATEITRDAAGIGQVLKTTSMRIRGYDEQTEIYSEDLEELSGKIADLTKTASTPGGISLFTDETKQTYKSTYDILKDISEIYGELSDKNQAELLEALAGKRNGQAIAAIISNFSAAEKSMDSMANSAGNAMKEMEVIYDSLDYKLNKLSETGTGVAQNLFAREDMKNIVDVLNSFMGLLDKTTEKLGLFGTATAGIGLFTGIKNVGMANYISSHQTSVNVV